MEDLAKRQSRDCPTGFQWYSCNLVGDTFAGCCAVDPCNPNGGCPVTALPPTTTEATALTSTTSLGGISVTTTSSVPSSTTLSTSSITSTSTSASSSAGVSTASSTSILTLSTTQPTVAPASSASGAAKASGAPVGAIVGAVIGGLLGLLFALALIAWFVYRRRRKQAQRKSATITRRKSMEPVHGEEGQGMFAPFGGTVSFSRRVEGVTYNLAGFYRGVDDQHAEKASHANDTPISRPDGYTYQALDKESPEPLPDKNRISQLDGSPISELADTSPIHPHGFTAQPQYIAYSPAHNSARVSPITPTDSDNTRRRHAMSWNYYDASEANSPPSRLTSNVSPKTSDPETNPDSRRGTWS